jgi:polar amino acid transport system substrate-binding protein
VSRKIQRRLAWPVIAIVFILSACIPPEPDDDLIVNYDPEETVMGEIQQRGQLVVGTPEGRPPFDGFTLGFGRLVAEALGVESREVPLPPEELITAPEEGVVDISFPLVAITEKLVRHHAFTDPVYIAHQRLLVPEASGISEVDDLGGLVCQFIAREVHQIDKNTFVLSDIGVNVKELNPEVAVVEPPDPTGCLQDLRKQEVEAVSASDWLLYPALSEKGDELAIVGEDLTTEGYGAVIEAGASAWTDFVNGVFAEAGAEGDWQRLYDEWFGPYSDEEITFPDMTVEEAAALFPSDV